jgi:hypothetical protein
LLIFIISGGGQQRIRLLDNNLNALPNHFEIVVKQLIKEKLKVDFSQGLDIRLITLEMAQLLAQVKLWKSIHFAWDNIKDEKEIREGIKILERGGVKLYNCMFYVLVGFNSTEEEDLYRINTLWKDLGVYPFVMPFNKKDRYQKDLARWVNHKAIFKTVEWKDYRRSRNVYLSNSTC